MVVDSEGTCIHAANWPLAELYSSISWFSFVTPSDAVNRMSDPSDLAEACRLESLGSEISTGKFVRLEEPETCPWLIVITFRCAQALLYQKEPAAPTMKLQPLLATPPTVTTTLPVVAPTGTGTTMLVALQLVGVAEVPLNATVLLPCVGPKLVPVIVTEAPTGAGLGEMLLMRSVGVTVKLQPPLATPPTVTTTFPVVAPTGTGTTILVPLQLVGEAAAPLNITVLLPCVDPKFVPVMVTGVPAMAGLGEMPLMLGGGVTVKLTPLLATPPTVTTTFPVVAPEGTGTTMLVAFQLLGVAAVPLNVTVLLPGDDPKLLPAIVTEVPTAPELGDRLLIVGGPVNVAEAIALSANPFKYATACTVSLTLTVNWPL
jgi:hypothetical protein